MQSQVWGSKLIIVIIIIIIIIVTSRSILKLKDLKQVFNYNGGLKNKIGI
jgi:hypothetical protein